MSTMIAIGNRFHVRRTERDTALIYSVTNRRRPVLLAEVQEGDEFLAKCVGGEVDAVCAAWIDEAEGKAPPRKPVLFPLPDGREVEAREMTPEMAIESCILMEEELNRIPIYRKLQVLILKAVEAAWEKDVSDLSFSDLIWEFWPHGK